MAVIRINPTTIAYPRTIVFMGISIPFFFVGRKGEEIGLMGLIRPMGPIGHASELFGLLSEFVG